MSDEIAIRVAGLSKFYRQYQRPQHRLIQGAFGMVSRLSPSSALGLRLRQRGDRYSRLFWAVKDVSFEVGRGEIVGIIGRNGAGKSTLLQMICGTVTPSEGEVDVRGRVAALLELGAGFNPEFSGRDNVYVNGSILGLSRAEIDDRFEKIVDFAELHDFIDEPVKVYSSGMFLRLAFSVAVHVDPEILVVDEALSVGDLAFRNKCTDRIREMVARGVTVLFVTHDLGTLQLLCSKVIWLEKGGIKAAGDAVEVSQEYHLALLKKSESSDAPVDASMPVQHETGRALFTEVTFPQGTNPRFAPGDSFCIRFALLAKQAIGQSVIGVSIYRSDGDWLIGVTSRDQNIVWPAADAGKVLRGELYFDSLALAPGDYVVAVAAYSSDLSTCYGLTDASLRFSVRASYPTWGKFIHPSRWIIQQ